MSTDLQELKELAQKVEDDTATDEEFTRFFNEVKILLSEIEGEIQSPS